MQISPINNNIAFKACYKMPFTWERHHELMGALKEEGMQNAIAIYGKADRYAKDIAVFRNPFPYEHLYNEELISVLLDNNRITEEEAAKYGIKFNIFNSARMSREVQCEILNSRLNNVRNKGTDVDSIFKGGKDIYITTCDDTEALKNAMAKKIEVHFKECFGERKEIDPLEALNAMVHFYPGPKSPPAEPKRNFIQKIIDRRNAKKEAILFQNIKQSIQELKNQLIIGNLSREEIERITNEIRTLESELAKQPEPRYIRNMRLLVEQYKQEKERFNNLFFKDREVIPVKSVEELLTKL